MRANFRNNRGILSHELGPDQWRERIWIICVQVSAQVDAGDILAERRFPIGPDDQIADLQTIANKAFPEMLLGVLSGLEERTLRSIRQDESRAAYYPLRFPDDGLVLWDQLTADESTTASAR